MTVYHVWDEGCETYDEKRVDAPDAFAAARLYAASEPERFRRWRAIQVIASTQAGSELSRTFWVRTAVVQSERVDVSLLRPGGPS